MKEWIGGSGEAIGAIESACWRVSTRWATNGAWEWWQKSHCVQHALSGPGESAAAAACSPGCVTLIFRQQLSVAARVAWSGSTNNSRIMRKRRIVMRPDYSNYR